MEEGNFAKKKDKNEKFYFAIVEALPIACFPRVLKIRKDDTTKYNSNVAALTRLFPIGGENN